MLRLRLATVGIVALVSARAWAADDCVFVAGHDSWSLRASCTTDATLVVPVSRLDGRGFTITAVDPPGGHFLGAVVRSGGPELNVFRLRVTTAALANLCDPSDDRLAGILLDGARGGVTFSSVVAINQGPSGCQEGNGIVARNAVGARPVDVRLDGNAVTGYQKTGILVTGAVRASVAGNQVDGGGATGSIARNGIQIGGGASAAVRFNRISGNSFTGATTVGAGVLVIGGPHHGMPLTTDVDITNNAITGADVGVYLDNSEADGGAAETPTRVSVMGNYIFHGEVTNGVPYSAGVLVIGNRDRITHNRIDGAAYDPATLPGQTFDVDARFAIAPIVAHNR
jgi:autotransporter-associated beta strand protein